MINSTKKKITIILFSFILIYLYVYFQIDPNIKEFEKIYNQKLPSNITSKDLYNTYNGIPYEGEKLCCFSFGKEDIDKFISKIKISKNWNSLPLSETLELILFGGSKDKKDYNYKFAIKAGLPKIKNGYWSFVNKNKSDLLNSNSYNFSIAILDIDNNIMYLYKIDT